MKNYFLDSLQDIQKGRLPINKNMFKANNKDKRATNGQVTLIERT